MTVHVIERQGHSIQFITGVKIVFRDRNRLISVEFFGEGDGRVIWGLGSRADKPLEKLFFLNLPIFVAGFFN